MYLHRAWEGHAVNHSYRNREEQDLDQNLSVCSLCDGNSESTREDLEKDEMDNRKRFLESQPLFAHIQNKLSESPRKGQFHI
jgi:hypothetical protein